MEPAKETFKYYLVHYLNKYAASKIVGFDAVYVLFGRKLLLQWPRLVGR